MYLSVSYEERDITAYCVFPTLPVFDTRNHAKWECTRSTTRVYAKIHGFANNTVDLRSARFTMDAEVLTAVQKVLWVIPAMEFEKTMTQKWQEQILECIINHKKYWKGVCWWKCYWYWLELISNKIFVSEHIFLQVTSNMFHINHSSSEPIYTTNFILVLFGRYWIILHARYGFVPIGSAACLYKDFSHYFWDNL